MSSAAEWNLSPLVTSPDIASIQQHLKTMVQDALALRDQYYNNIHKFDASQLHTLLIKKDAYTLQHRSTLLYCRLRYAADSTDSVAQQLHEAERQETMRARQALAFLPIEIGQRLTQNPSLLTHTVLGEYQHYLERLLQRSSHLLSETEERLVLLKDMRARV